MSRRTPSPADATRRRAARLGRAATESSLGRLWSGRLLGLASDGALVEEIRGGNEAAFSVAFERHAAGLLGFCRHMVGSPEDAEDAVQHTFVAAFRDLAGPGERELALKPWLYAIARNRCLSVLRSRRERTSLDVDLPTEGLAEQVERRAELRDLLRDLRELPEDQCAALLLSEAGDLTHAEVAGVLGCDVANVKALVFRARDGLIQRRDARETPCADIREQLANLRGNSLRRSALRHHLRRCAGCRDYREQLKRQRRMLAAALPVVSSLDLKSSVLAAAGLGGGSSGAGLAAGVGTGLFASVGAGTLVKVAAVGLLAGGAATAGTALVAEGKGLLTASPKSAARGHASARPMPSRAHDVAGRPVTHSLREPEPSAPGDPADRYAQAQPLVSEEPSAALPKDNRTLGNEQDANAAPPTDAGSETGQARGYGDSAATVDPAPKSSGPAVSPPDATPGKRGPPPGHPDQGGPPSGNPGQGGPTPDNPGQGGPPPGNPGQGGPPSGTPSSGGSPPGTLVEHRPPQHPPPNPHTSEPNGKP
jgi:RNA polymerase sigma factor (sigma-70 family)